MNNQTRALLTAIPPATPPFVSDLLNAYVAINPATTLCLDLYAEPYYGNFNNPSLVLLTHNPGQSTTAAKGLGSPFEGAIDLPPLTREGNYFTLATNLGFPNPATNTWIINRNNDLQNHFNQMVIFKQKLFIRDLVPYHGRNWSKINMTLCIKYLYEYFFCQVIEASFNSELYMRINAKKIKPTSIIYARGKAWKDRFGLRSIGWDFIGRIYWNCYIFKANFEKIRDIAGQKLENWSGHIFKHDIYIVVITQVRQGAPFGIYANNKSPLIPITLIDVIDNYYKITDQNSTKYIEHTNLLDDFFNTVKNL